jgi:hypothetical protein
MRSGRRWLSMARYPSRLCSTDVYKKSLCPLYQADITLYTTAHPSWGDLGTDSCCTQEPKI